MSPLKPLSFDSAKNLQEMARNKKHLKGLVERQFDITVTMRILIATDRAGEQVRPRLSFGSRHRKVGQRPIIHIEGLAHQSSADEFRG